jgi:hypothetical protein
MPDRAVATNDPVDLVRAMRSQMRELGLAFEPELDGRTPTGRPLLRCRCHLTGCR